MMDVCVKKRPWFTRGCSWANWTNHTRVKRDSRIRKRKRGAYVMIHDRVDPNSFFIPSHGRRYSPSENVEREWCSSDIDGKWICPLLRAKRHDQGSLIRFSC